MWRGQAGWRLPANLPSNNYQWQLTLCATNCFPPVPIGNLQITAPNRLWEEPSLPQSRQMAVQAGDVAILRSVAISPTSVTLLWQATAETADSYHVFIHLLDENGGIIAQSDGEPAGWTRPTSGWLPDEFLIDEHLLTMDNAGIQLAIGMYNPATGNRVPLFQDGNRLLDDQFLFEITTLSN